MNRHISWPISPLLIACAIFYNLGFADTFSNTLAIYPHKDLGLPADNGEHQIDSNAEHLVARLCLLADSLLKHQHIPGLAFGIIKDQKILLKRGFGYRDTDRKLAVDENTIFSIGSCTKAFTATSIALLVDQGLLGWSDRVKSHLPTFKLYDDFATERSTAIDLLTHRSGLPRHDLMWYGSTHTRDELFDRLQYLEPTFDFRTSFQYQNLMYMAAGVLVEKITDSTWEDFTDSNILDPLQMYNSKFSIDDYQDNNNVSLPYSMNNGMPTLIDHRDISAVGPAGSINSSITDMLHWVQFNLNQGKYGDQEIISKDQFEILHTGHMIVNQSLGDRLQPQFGPFAYGGGWFVCEYMGHKIVWHGGGIDGFTALVWLIPDQDIGMVLLCNTMGSKLPQVLANYATDWLLGIDQKVDWVDLALPSRDSTVQVHPETSIAVDASDPGGAPLTLKALAGIYFNPGYGHLEVTHEEGNLGLLYNSLDLELRHLDGDTFEGKGHVIDTEMTFEVAFIRNVRDEISRVALPLQAGLKPILFNAAKSR